MKTRIRQIILSAGLLLTAPAMAFNFYNPPQNTDNDNNNDNTPAPVNPIVDNSSPEPTPNQWDSLPNHMINTIELTWKEMTGGFEGRTGARPRSASVTNYRNFILDQVMENGGTLNYCVRYESNVPVSAGLRDDIERAVRKGVNDWFNSLEGYNGFPHKNIDVNVVGWAVRNRSVVQWNDDSMPVYVGDYSEGAPQCPQVCGRFFNRQPGYNYPQCPGGRANHYDQSLWLTEGMNGGAGGDWGQRVGRAYFTDNVNSDSLHIYLHEMGHGLGFPDYYNWQAWTGAPLPDSVMVAGAAFKLTEWDRWMFRYTWDQMKSRW